MEETLVQLLGGFVLTTIVGTALGHYFQNRSWRHQHDAELFETERKAAAQVFAELSTLMDKRLYRMCAKSTGGFTPGRTTRWSSSTWSGTARCCTSGTTASIGT